MAYGLPDNLWIGLLVMAVIILALLWKDKISKGNSKPTPEPDGPSVSMTEVSKNSSHTVGETFALKGTYDAGDSSIRRKSLTMNGRDISSKIESWSNGTFRTSRIEIPEVEKIKCKIKVETRIGDAFDDHVFDPSPPSEPDGPGLDLSVETTNTAPGQENGSAVVTASPIIGDAEISRTEVRVPNLGKSESSAGNNDCVLSLSNLPAGEYQAIAETSDTNKNSASDTENFEIEVMETDLRVEASYNVVSHDSGEVELRAEVVEASADIIGTTIKMREKNDWDSEDDGWDGNHSETSLVEYQREGLEDNVYEFEGKTEDEFGNIDTDRGTFEIGVSGGPGGSIDDLPEGVQGIFQNTNNNFNGVPPQYLEVIRDIIDQTGGRDQRGDVTQKVGMDAYQLLLALSTLEPDLTGDDNSQILAELKTIRQEVGQDQISPDELENALRNVMQDVFGQDLQGVIQGLDLGNGFDEQAIVQAIEDKDVDIDLTQVTNRLDNIEQAVNQVQSQGGDMSNVEQKLDDIESAVRDIRVDDQIYQDLTQEIQALRNKGLQVNIDMNDPLIIKLVEDIERSGNPQAERRRILQAIRGEGVLTRRLLIRLLGDEEQDDESGGTGNKNPENEDSGMADEGTKVKKFDAQELKSLEEDIDALSDFVKDFDQLDFQKARKLKNEIEKEVNNVEQELKDVHDQAELFTNLVDDINDWSQGGKNKQDIIDEIENSYKHENKIREELKDIHNKMSQIRRKVKDVEDLCTQFNEVLGVSENEFSSTVDSITEDMHRMDNLIEHVNEYVQGHREGQGDEYVPDEVLGGSPR